MKTTLLTISSIIGLLLNAILVSANPNHTTVPVKPIIVKPIVSIPAQHDNINKRQRKQKHRIAHGVVTGDLNRKETKTLVKTQRKINRIERKFRSDGKLTLRERNKIRKIQNQASRQIKRKRNN